MSETTIGLLLTVILAFIGLGVAALAVSSHPDRVKTAKIFFSLAALVFAVMLTQWTISTGRGLLARTLVNIFGLTLAIIGLIAGFRFADRSSLAEREIPSSAIVPEPSFVQNKKLMAKVLVGVLALTALINGGRVATGWGWSEMAVLSGLPWRWILPSVIFGLLISTVLPFFSNLSRTKMSEVEQLKEDNARLLKAKQEAEAKLKPDTQIIQVPSIVPCGEELLHNFAETDRGWIDKAVWISCIDPQPDGLTRGAPYIDFKFFIYNSSVFPVSIDESISGYITYREGNHQQKLDLHSSLDPASAKKIPARGEGQFTVTQHLIPTQAELFRNRSDVTFSFDHLVIKVKGWNKSDKIITQQLDTRSKPCGTTERYLNYEPKAAIAYKNLPFIRQNGAPQEELIRLQESCSRLQAIADDQARSIYRFVHLKVEIGKHELLREHPYIEFVFAVDNRSLYDISFEDSLGTISFADRELTEQPKWRSRPTITQGNGGSVTIRETLTKGDVTKILNGIPSNKFDFSALGIKASSADGVEPTALHAHHLAVTNEDLIAAYPKLDIRVERAVYDWAMNRSFDQRDNSRSPLYVTLRLTVTNRRPSVGSPGTELEFAL